MMDVTLSDSRSALRWVYTRDSKYSSAIAISVLYRFLAFALPSSTIDQNDGPDISDLPFITHHL
jgi:hypothetical protein